MTNNKLLLIILLLSNLIIIGILIYSHFKSNFGNILTPDACFNSNLSSEELCSCINNMNTLSNNISSTYEGQPANRGLQNGNDVCGGSFGNTNCIK